MNSGKFPAEPSEKSDWTIGLEGAYPWDLSVISSELTRISNSLPVTQEDLAKIGDPSALGIKKHGMKMNFSYESFEFSKGRLESVGVKWIQYIGYVWTKAWFRFYRWLEGRLERSRHVLGVTGYDYDPAMLRKFEQKQKRVEDD